MKKFSNFVINKRFFIFGILMLLFVGSILFIPKVTINKDMTKYLPDDSSMKAGINIINEEFPGTLDQKGIRVMFKGLKDEEIPVVLNTLKGIENVKGVSYDESDNYNKGEFTLFILDSDFSYKSKEEKQIEKDVKKIFEEENVIVQHVMYATTTIPVWVLIVAFSALTIILFIMCSSWIDPLLFLLTIGIAVVLNFGTNIIMGEVSESTFSLSAILQLVLSMDYSIILMNRYRQIKEEGETDSKVAMKEAFRSAFPSIVGSAFTTIVGLLMLIFMDFKLGMDLGIVMAKGVFLSMICVLTILPTFIIWFDKLIFKLNKKTLHPTMKRVVKFEYKYRYFVLGFFLVLFISVCFLQGLTGTTFAQVKNDKIGEVFPAENNAIIVYDNEDNEKIDELIKKINEDEGIKQVLSYNNTIGMKMNSESMNMALKAMGGNIELSDKIINMIYYNYYNENTYTTLTLPEFYKIIKEDIMTDPMFSKFFTDEIKNKINSISIFMDKEFINTNRTALELSQILNIDSNKLDILYPLYYSLSDPYVPNKMDINEFIEFMKTTVIPNPIFSSYITEEVLGQFTELEKITNVEMIKTPLPKAVLAQNLGLPNEFVELVFTLKFGPGSENLLSIYDFVGYVLSDVITKPEYSNLLDQNSVAKLGSMKQIMDLAISKTKLGFDQMAQIIVIDSNPGINQIMLKLIYNYKDHLANKVLFKISLTNLINFTVNVVLPLPMFNGFISEQEKQLLTMANTIMASVNSDKAYNNEEMYALINPLVPSINKQMMDLMYLISSTIKCEELNTYMLSIDEVMTHIETKILNDPRFNGLITVENKEMINGAIKLLKDNKKRLVGEKHSLIVLDLKVKEESKETTEFFDRLEILCKDNLTKDYHFVGNSPMNVEMEKGFGKDLLLITILTAVAIFVIVALTFRSIIIPLILVLLVQCGVFMTVCISGLIGHSIFYLALLIVQCILMGATIDYAIVFTSYYQEMRKTKPIIESLNLAYENSLHTIMTSGLIIILVTGLIGMSPADPAISEICITLSLGTLCAVLLILFVLPALISAFDKVITRERKIKKKTKEETLEE